MCIFSFQQAEKPAGKRKGSTTRSTVSRHLKRRKVSDNTNTDIDKTEVANILVELKKNVPTRCATTAACTATTTSNFASLSVPVELDSPVSDKRTCDKQTQTGKKLDPSLLVVKLENITLKHEITRLRQQVDKYQQDRTRATFGLHGDAQDNTSQFYTEPTIIQSSVLGLLGSAQDGVHYWNQQLKTEIQSPSSDQA